jgi:hypothetical protein
MTAILTIIAILIALTIIGFASSHGLVVLPCLVAENLPTDRGIGKEHKKFRILELLEHEFT